MLFAAPSGADACTGRVVSSLSWLAALAGIASSGGEVAAIV